VSTKAGETNRCPHCHHALGLRKSGYGAICPHCRK
jgi:primosomal protein N'